MGRVQTKKTLLGGSIFWNNTVDRPTEQDGSKRSCYKVLISYKRTNHRAVIKGRTQETPVMAEYASWDFIVKDKIALLVQFTHKATSLLWV